MANRYSITYLDQSPSVFGYIFRRKSRSKCQKCVIEFAVIQINFNDIDAEVNVCSICYNDSSTEELLRFSKK